MLKKYSEENDDDVHWKDIKYQILVTNVIFLLTMQAGISLSFSNLVLQDLNTVTSSWFASIVTLSVPIGTCIAGPLMDKIGRKRANIIIAAFIILTWFFTCISTIDGIIMFYFIRVLSGIASELIKFGNLRNSRFAIIIGLTVTSVVYVSEISHKKYRSMLLSLLSVYFSLGILLTAVLNSIFTWSQTALCFTFVFTLILFLICVITPESPVWLANFRSDLDDAKRNLKKLYSNKKIFETEWNYLKQNELPIMKQSTNNKYNFTSALYYKPVFILVLLFLLQQLSGTYTVIVYAINIFSKISPHVGNIAKDEAFIMLGLIRLIASTASSLLSIRIGRRVLLMSSSFGMFFSCLLVIICTIKSFEININDANLQEWISLLAFLLFIFTSSFGVMTVPWTLIVELLPTETKVVGNSIIMSYGYLLMFIMTKVFPFAIDVIEISYIFAFFGFISICLIVFVYFYIPETLGKSFRDIEKCFITS